MIRALLIHGLIHGSPGSAGANLKRDLVAASLVNKPGGDFMPNHELDKAFLDDVFFWYTSVLEVK